MLHLDVMGPQSGDGPPATDVVRHRPVPYNLNRRNPRERCLVPELPEVETIVRDLRPRLAGRRLSAVKPASRHALRKPWDAAWNAEVAGRLVEHVRRRGKWILVGLEGEKTLVIHLGMTGQLVVTPAAEPVSSHTHLIFPLDDGTEELRFRDIRRFGSATLYRSRQELEDFFVEAGLGPEPFNLRPAYWRHCLRATKRC